MELALTQSKQKKEEICHLLAMLRQIRASAEHDEIVRSVVVHVRHPRWMFLGLFQSYMCR